MVISRKIHNKKVTRYLNKQNVCITYEDISRHNRKWEAAVLGGESRTMTLLKGVSTYSSIGNVSAQTESVLLHFTNSNLFQPNPSVTDSDSGGFKSVQILGTFSPWNSRRNCTLLNRQVEGSETLPRL